MSETLSQWPANVKRPLQVMEAQPEPMMWRSRRDSGTSGRGCGLDTVMGFSDQVSLEDEDGELIAAHTSYLLHHELDCLPFNSHNYP